MRGLTMVRMLVGRGSSSSVIRNISITFVLCMGLYLACYVFVIQEDRAVSKPMMESNALSCELKQKSNGVLVDSQGTDYGQHLFHELDPSLVPNTVFFVWCGQPRWFEFRNYLSVMSAIRNLRPDNIVFYYENLPTVDKMFYNTWFDDLRANYPFFNIIPLPDAREACNADGLPRKTFVQSLVTKYGGLYVGEDTILSNVPKWALQADFVNGLGNDAKNGIFLSQRNISLTEKRRNRREKDTRIQCLDQSAINQHSEQPVCLTSGVDISPESIWETDTNFGKLARWVAYGSPEIKRAEKSSDNPAPYIAHMIWIRGKPMDFLFYLCVLSAIYVAKFDRIYIHGDLPPSGEYWEKIKHHEKITLIHRNSMGMSIYGNEVRRVAHWSDAVRLEIMIKYGGVYIDTDLLIVKPLDRELFKYDVVATYDFPDRSPFPNSFSCGFMIGKRHAKFWYLFQQSMKWFMDKNWEWNGLLQPYKVMERNPGLVHMERRLQVICLHALCHPTWWEDHKNMTYHHLNSGIPLNWRQNINIFHFCGKYPLALRNESNLMNSQDMFGEMGRFVLERAGLL